MSSNNQEKIVQANFEEDGVVWFENYGNDFVYQFMGTFDGASVYLEECAISWGALGMEKADWATDTTTTGLWTAISIDGTDIELTGPSGSNYVNTPKRFVRARCDGAGASADIVGEITYFKP